MGSAGLGHTLQWSGDLEEGRVYGSQGSAHGVGQQGGGGPRAAAGPRGGFVDAPPPKFI